MKRAREATYYPNKRSPFDDLPDDCIKMLFDLLVGSTISDHLTYGFKLKSGVNALANLIVASRRAWLLEQTHRYRYVAMINGHAPDQWFLFRTGRIETVSYNTFHIHNALVLRDLKTFSACGALVDITTNCSDFMMQNYTNFIKVNVTLSHLCWPTQFAAKFANMLKLNLDCQLTINTTPSCKHYRACEILRRTNQMEALVGFSGRLDVRGLRIMTRTASVRRWTFVNFPEADIYHASSRWSCDESTVTDEGSEAEEDSETDEDYEHNHDETPDDIE